MLPTLLLRLAPYLIVFGAIGGLYLGMNHYKDKYHDVEKSFEDYKTTQEAASKVLVAESERITKAHATVLAREGELLERNSKLVRAGILKDEELNSIKLSANAVQLFNQSTSTSSTNPTEAKQGDDGTANPTLATLLIVSDTNNRNHLKCVSQVLEWQSFWSEYERSVKAVGRDSEGVLSAIP